jgi:uridylate cyclase
MGLEQEVSAEVDSILSREWDIRDGTVVPETSDIALTGGAVRLEATMLYSDLADSTELAIAQDRRVTAKVYKSFLAMSSRVIRASGGEIRSFDGDRVMGIFLGKYKNTTAAKCALMINYGFVKIVKPKLEAKYNSLTKGPFALRHAVGVDTSEILVVRAGIRSNNDLAWVGRAPNVAAKLSTLRETPYHSFVTEDVYKVLASEAKSANNRDMWERRSWAGTTGVSIVYRSSWTWKL